MIVWIKLALKLRIANNYFVLEEIDIALKLYLA